MNRSKQAGASRRRLGILWFPLALIVLVLAVGFARNADTLLNGQFVGIDDYSRLAQVAEFQRSGDWYQPRLPRSNTPFGEPRTWSRPLDVLLLGGGLALGSVMDFTPALHLWAMMLSPLLLVATMLAFFWAVAPLLERKGQMLLGVIMLTQPAVIAQFMIGRPDHHAFQALIFVLLLGSVVRMVGEPEGRRWALLGGLAAALALWTSVEALVIIIVVQAALALHWYRDGGARERGNLLFAAALSVFVVAAALAERPPGQWTALAYDRLSIVHVLLFSLVVLFWLLVWGGRRFGLTADSVGRRVALSVAGAALGLGLIWLFHPDFFAGPMALVPARVREIWDSHVAEYSSTIRPASLAESIHFTFFYLGPALVAAAYLPDLFVRGRARERTAWLFPAFALAVFLALGLYQIRWTIYAQLLALPLYSHLLLRLLGALTAFDGRPVAGAVARAVTVLAFVGGFTAFGSVTGKLDAVSKSVELRQQRDAACDTTAAARYLTRSARYGKRPHAIMSLIFAGPELLYRTPHRFVATPNHRNAEGILDTIGFFSAANADNARAILARRRIELVLLCPGARETELYRGRDEQTLYDRLVAGHLPPWLQEAPVGKDDIGGYRIFEVKP